MTRVALLWHMHQPYYEDLVTREHIMPWVRLHALKDYYGMVALLEEFPAIHLTFNLVPSLLVQLEAFAQGRAHDRYLDVGMKVAESLTPDDVAFMLQGFFHAHRARMIDVYPRYAELLAMRGSAGHVESRARQFTTGDLRDLQVWQKLAWFDPSYLEDDGRVRALVQKGRDFSEADKEVLRAVELELLNAVIPAYRRRAEAGQIEIATSPFYHPILPLLCDTDIYKRTHPDSRMPRHRFLHSEDAREQLLRAADCHERLFGRRPTGLWPSEGSVSDAIVPLVAAAGFEWMATDELILARSLETAFRRDAAGRVDQPERLYTSYSVTTASGAQVACGFRDHALSDLIGFTYAGWPADRAADDFVGRLAEGGRRARDAGGADPVIFVILDGENAWEHYEGGGRPFLRALYHRLSIHPDLRTVTMAEACRGPSRTLESVFPGSWIDANFYIWIGHPDDHRAWSQLADARAALATPGEVDASSVARAHDEVLIAEGSDWFWWYGDDHSSDHDHEFDDLFRRHLRNAYRLLGKTVPDELFATNITSGVQASAQVDPTRLIEPTIDGENSSYFEWLGAGSVDLTPVAGAMHQSERREAVVAGLRFGFDESRLYLRIDGSRRLDELVRAGHAFGLVFLEPPGLRVRLTPVDARSLTASAVEPLRVGIGSVLEAALVLSGLGADGLETLSFFVTVNDASGEEVERHPSGRPIELRVPDASFVAANWSA